jgi:hypothetical protein
VRLAQRQAPEAAGFAAEREQIVRQLLQRQQASAFEALLARLRERSAIEINSEVLTP